MPVQYDADTVHEEPEHTGFFKSAENVAWYSTGIPT